MKVKPGPLHIGGNMYLVGGISMTHPWDATSYLITGPEPTLIDCGSSVGYPALKRSLAALGYQPSDITQVIGTHGHWDHLSGLAQLREEANIPLLLHEADRAQVETGDEDLTASFLYHLPFPPLRVDGTLRDGDVLDINGHQLTVLHTPGHTRGSISLLTEADGPKLLIAGDTIYGGYHPRIGADLDVWRKTLDRLRQLDIDVFTWGHSCFPILDAKNKIAMLADNFCTYFNPWFELIEYEGEE